MAKALVPTRSRLPASSIFAPREIDDPIEVPAFRPPGFEEAALISNPQRTRTRANDHAGSTLS